MVHASPSPCAPVSLCRCPPPTKASLWCSVDNMEESTVIIDRKKFASRRGGALRAHRRHQVSPHVSDRNGGKQMTEVGPALLEPLAPASQPCTALVMTRCLLTTTYYAEQLGGIWLGAWGLLVAAGSGGVKMCETQNAMQNAEARSEKRPLVHVVLRGFFLPRALVKYPPLIASPPRIPVKKLAAQAPPTEAKPRPSHIWPFARPRSCFKEKLSGRPF